MKNILEAAEDLSLDDFAELDSEFLNAVAGGNGGAECCRAPYYTTVCGITQCITISDCAQQHMYSC